LRRKLTAYGIDSYTNNGLVLTSASWSLS